MVIGSGCRVNFDMGRTSRAGFPPTILAMRKNATLPALFLFAITASTGCQPTVQWVDYGPDPMANEDFAKDYAASHTPGEAHAELKKGVGTWNVVGALYTAPGTGPIPAKGTCTVESVLGGRALLQRFYGDFGGEEFEGILLMGYDNLAGNYWSVWSDSMVTWPAPAAGGTDDHGNLRMTMELRDIRTPAGRPARMDIDYNRDGSHTQRIYDVTPDGDEFLLMELTYRRP